MERCSKHGNGAVSVLGDVMNLICSLDSLHELVLDKGCYTGVHMGPIYLSRRCL